MRWEYNGAMPSAKEQRGASWVANKATATSSALRRLLRMKARANEEARREMGARGVTGERWGVKWRAEARRDLTGQLSATCGLHAAAKL